MNRRQVDQYRVLFPKEGKMEVDAMVYASPSLLMEDESIRQLCNAASLPGVKKVLATPDIHTGYGVPIGSVVAMPEEIIPAAVGYDVNCGMRLLITPLSLDDIKPELKIVTDSIRRDVPLGEGRKNIQMGKKELKSVLEKGVRGMKEWAPEHNQLKKVWNEIDFDSDKDGIEDGGGMEGRSSAVSHKARDRGKNQIGTLGGGNHFIEIQLVKSVADEQIAGAFGIRKGQVLVMIHSGSRGLGHQIGSDYMPLAAGTSKAPDKKLGFFKIDSQQGKDYIAAMNAAANYAFVNRQIMAMFVRKNFRYYFGDIPMNMIYDVPHNMAKREKHNGETYWVHRKGATRAFPGKLMRGTKYERTGQPVIIPGSMGTASYLLAGCDSGAESLFSVNHGAGRTMSRRAAAGKVRRRDGKVIKPGRITEQRFRETMEGVYLVCEDKHSIREEAPDAYKDIDEVIRIVTGAGLAKLVARMTPLAVLKG